MQFIQNIEDWSYALSGPTDSYRLDPPQKSPSYSGATLPPSTFLNINPTTTWCPELKTRSLILNDKRFTVECFHCYLSMTLILHVVFLNIINFEEVYWLRRFFCLFKFHKREKDIIVIGNHHINEAWCLVFPRSCIIDSLKSEWFDVGSDTWFDSVLIRRGVHFPF